jgi:NAD(P)-dependent dehydrogenase (short-subunit alcohol dehydrogenase family)
MDEAPRAVLSDRVSSKEERVGLKDKIAVVTGGASGIGRAISLRLAREGCHVAIWDRDVSGAQRVGAEVGELGRRMLSVQVDVSSFGDVEQAADRVRRELGKASILVNNAGYGEIITVAQMSEAQWDKMIAVHLKGTFNCTRHLVQDMIDAGWGRIVNISSVAGLRGAAAFVHYSAAKAGIAGFSKALALELGSSGITVNAIAPGLIDTPILKGSALRDETIAGMVRHTPVGRIGAPEDIAACCAYIVAEEASFLTGQVLSPNGGLHT